MNSTAVQYLIALVVPAVVALALGVLWKSRKDRARRDPASAALVLEYGGAVKSVPVLVAAAWAVLVPIVIHDDPIRRENLPAFLLLALLIAVPLAVTAIEAFGVAHRVTPGGIEKRSPWSRRATIEWANVAEISFSRGMQWFVVCDATNKIRLHLYLNGLEDFARAVRERVPAEKWTQAKTALDGLFPE